MILTQLDLFESREPRVGLARLPPAAEDRFAAARARNSRITDWWCSVRDRFDREWARQLGPDDDRTRWQHPFAVLVWDAQNAGVWPMAMKEQGGVMWGPEGIVAFPDPAHAERLRARFAAHPAIRAALAAGLEALDGPEGAYALAVPHGALTRWLAAHPEVTPETRVPETPPPPPRRPAAHAATLSTLAWESDE